MRLGRQDAGYRLFPQGTRDGTDSLWHLLHRLLQTMDCLQACVKRRLALASSRERFADVHKQQKALLGTLIQYLFHVCSNTPPKQMRLFSVSTAQYVEDTALSKKLDTREGVLLRALLFHPSMQAIVSSQRSQSEAARVRGVDGQRQREGRDEQRDGVGAVHSASNGAPRSQRHPV